MTLIEEILNLNSVSGITTGSNFKITICRNPKCIQFSEMIPHFQDEYCPREETISQKNYI